MKNRLLIVSGVLVLATLLAGCSDGDHLVEEAKGGPHIVTPAPTEDIEEDGTRKDQTDPNAPKTIESKQIILFDCWFSTLDIAEPGVLGNHIYHLQAELEDGAVKGSYQVRDTDEEWSFRADHSFLNEVFELVDRYEIAQFNGHSVEVAGLPSDYGVNLDVRFASGEHIYASDNEGNFLPYSFMDELEKLFERGAAIPPTVLDVEVNDLFEGQEATGDSHAEVFVTRADSEVTAYYECQRSYEDEGLAWVTTHNLDAKTGRELKFSDVFRDMEYLPSLLLMEFERAYPYQTLYDDALDFISQSVELDDGNVSFALGYGCVHVFADGYVLSESPEALHITISYVLNPYQVRAFYTTAPQRWMIPLDYDVLYWSEDISVGFRMHSFPSPEGEDVLWVVTVEGGDAEPYEENFYGYVPECWLIHIPGHDYIYLRVPNGDVSMQTQIYEVGGQGVSKRTFEPIPLALHGDTPLNPDRMKCALDEPVMDGVVAMLPSGWYEVDKDGLPELIGGVYDLDGPWVALREGGRYNPDKLENAAMSGGMWTLISGQPMKPYQTDMESFLDFITDDGRVVRFEIDRWDGEMRLDNFGMLSDVFKAEMEGMD